MKKELIKNDRRKKYKGIGRQRLIIVQNKIILQPDLNFLHQAGRGALLALTNPSCNRELIFSLRHLLLYHNSLINNGALSLVINKFLSRHALDSYKKVFFYYFLSVADFLGCDIFYEYQLS